MVGDRFAASVHPARQLVADLLARASETARELVRQQYSVIEFGFGVLQYTVIITCVLHIHEVIRSVNNTVNW